MIWTIQNRIDYIVFHATKHFAPFRALYADVLNLARAINTVAVALYELGVQVNQLRGELQKVQELNQLIIQKMRVGMPDTTLPRPRQKNDEEKPN